MPRIYKRNCDVCGIFYESSASRYCSRKCWYFSYKKSINWHKFKDKKCLDCNVIYKPTNSTGKRCKNCSLAYAKSNEVKKMRVRYAESWRKRNKEYSKKRYWKYPERERIKSANRIHLKRANGGRGFTLKEWEDMKRFFNFTCQLCKRKEPEIKLTQDHIIPVIRGGRHERENIQPLCKSCNSKLGKKD